MTGLTIHKERRPLAMFEYADNGSHIIAKIMQHGDKFSVTEKNAEEWLAHIHQEALQGRYDATWVAQFKLEYEAFQKGDVNAARDFQDKLAPVRLALSLGTGNGAVKEALSLMGKPCGPNRRPIGPLSVDKRATLKQVLEAAGLLG